MQIIQNSCHIHTKILKETEEEKKVREEAEQKAREEQEAGRTHRQDSLS